MNTEKLKALDSNEWIKKLKETKLKTKSFWLKNDYHRIYFNDLQKLYGLDVNFYKTGNISSASLREKAISNNKAKKIWRDLAAIKIWYDVKTKEFDFRCDCWLYGDENEYFDAIVKAIKEKIAH
jgi:hypothetical protein